ncbi:hypothetical protein BH10BDE1_BH10BDE1_17100 [soil metagenome]
MSQRELFMKGQYKKIVDQFDRSTGKASRAEASWIAASLALLGRIDDALHLGRADDAIARFYITISMIRSGRSEKAAKALADFIRGSDRESDEGRFFVYQTLGFRAFIEGRFNKSLYWSDRAWGIALRMGGRHEKILSADLRGHSLIQIGQIAQGLESLESALEIARRFGNISHVAALRAAIAIAEVEHGFRTGESLQEMLEESSTLDSYTSANLLGELARQANLRGRYREALQFVAQTRPLVKVVRNKRQIGFLAVREAYSHFRLGNHARAIEILESAEAKLERRDRAVLIEAKGLRFQILVSKPSSRSLSQKKQIEILKREIVELAYEVKSRRSLSFIKTWTNGSLVLPGEPTPVELWIHGATELHVRLELLERGYLSFFESLIDSNEENAILLSLVPGQVLFRTRRQLSAEEDRFSSVIRRGLLILAKSRCSKQDLVQLVWGYEYEAFRHDTLIYTFISRLRVALGPLRSLLTYSKSDDTYGFSEAVRVKVLQFEPDSEPGSESFQSIPDQHLTLNLRQLDVLGRMRAARREARGAIAMSTTPHELIQRFQISRATATRDLNELTANRMLIRRGSGRGTQYVLREAWTTETSRGL